MSTDIYLLYVRAGSWVDSSVVLSSNSLPTLRTGEVQFCKRNFKLNASHCMVHANKETHIKFFSVIKLKTLRWNYPYLFTDKLRNKVKCMALSSFEANKKSTKMSHPRQIDAVPIELYIEQNSSIHALPGTKGASIWICTAKLSV